MKYSFKRLNQYHECCVLVNQFFNNTEKTYEWMNTRHHLLGNLTPMDILRAKRGKYLIEFVKNMLEGNHI